MVKLISLTGLYLFCFMASYSQELPEYTNSAMAWNSDTRQSIPLAVEEGFRKDKVGGAMIGKTKVIMQFKGERSNARIKAQDTLKIFVNIDKATNPQGLFKIFRTTIVKGNREVLVMQTSMGRIERFDGDYSYSIKKISPGIFSISILGVKPNEELFFYIGTHESSLAKLTLGID